MLFDQPPCAYLVAGDNGLAVEHVGKQQKQTELHKMQNTKETDISVKLKMKHECCDAALLRHIVQQQTLACNI